MHDAPSREHPQHSTVHVPQRIRTEGSGIASEVRVASHSTSFPLRSEPPRSVSLRHDCHRRPCSNAMYTRRIFAAETHVLRFSFSALVQRVAHYCALPKPAQEGSPTSMGDMVCARRCCGDILPDKIPNYPLLLLLVLTLHFRLVPQVNYPPPPPVSRQALAPIAPPVGPPDAPCCQATGAGIGGGTAGEAAPFTVITYDAVRGRSNPLRRRNLLAPRAMRPGQPPRAGPPKP